MNCQNDCPLVDDCNACLSCKHHATSYESMDEVDDSTRCGICVQSGTNKPCMWESREEKQNAI